MSIVNRSHRFIFVHVPKSAGTSVTTFLSKYTTIGDIEIGGTPFGETLAIAYGDRFKLFKHSTALEIREIVGSEIWSSFFSFGFVRNPYARAYSSFRFLRDHFRDWPGSSVMDEFDSFDEFVKSDFFASEGPDRLLNPQNFWLKTSETSGNPCVDFVGRVERLDRDIAAVLERILGVEACETEMKDPIPHINASTESDYWISAYTRGETVDIVRERYREDFRVFGYSADPKRD